MTHATDQSIIERIALYQRIVNVTTPWACTHFGNQSEIETYNETTEKWETIAEVHSTADFDAEDIASFIVEVVNSCPKANKHKQATPQKKNKKLDKEKPFLTKGEIT